MFKSLRAADPGPIFPQKIDTFFLKCCHHLTINERVLVSELITGMQRSQSKENVEVLLNFMRLAAVTMKSLSVM